MENPFSRVSFPAALGLLAGVTVVGVAAAVLSQHREDAWLVAPLVGVLAVLFLVDYAQRPGPEPDPVAGGSGVGTAGPELPAGPTSEGESPSEGSLESEPFEDPVELADRADAQARSPEAVDEPGLPTSVEPGPEGPEPGPAEPSEPSPPSTTPP